MEKAFMDENANDLFAKLSDKDLQELIDQIAKCYLTYRPSLNLPDNLTFGVEIEYERAFKWITDIYVKMNFLNWVSKCDNSLGSGGEVTSPIMTDKNSYWQELNKICNFLTINNADTLHNAGGHVHIGANILGENIKAWRIFLKLYMNYEHILFRFGYGDKISGRANIIRYARPIANNLYEYLLYDINRATNIIEMRCALPGFHQYQALNFQHYIYYHYHSFSKANKETLEFKMPNGSTNAIIWQNNINAFAKMLLSSKLGDIDEEFLDYKIEHEFISYKSNPYLYNNVCLQNALEFVDLIFNNNLDKIYFLRQYLKDFQENNGIKKALRAKRFWK